MKLAFVSSDSAAAEKAAAQLRQQYGDVDIAQADTIVAVGGDGLMLQTLHDQMRDRSRNPAPIFGLMQGSIGFLMNAMRDSDLVSRIENAQSATLHPLVMRVEDVQGTIHDGLAINEVSLLRQSHQTAKLAIHINGVERLPELICDGALLATPAGSTAYNLSAQGPIIPLGARLLALTPISPFRPRRWRGALLPEKAQVRFINREPEKRPVSATADAFEVRNIAQVDVRISENRALQLLFDPEHNLEERILREQFTP